MKMSSILAATAALTLIAAPAVAAPNAASSLSLGKSARAGTATNGKSKAAGAGILALILVAGVVAIPVIDAVKDDNSDSN